ncbi:MAG: flagellar filament capping protein FliD [Sideroxyarcus sp.]|nr:flagellar filament capping protein FliD [Sideroxyarcus sp.]
MATISSTTGSALDVPSLVSLLMANERRPIQTLTSKVSSYEAKISSMGTIKGLAASLQTALQGLNTSLQANSATPSDTSVVSATASSSAAAGTYSLNVTTLAQAQKLAAAGQASDASAISAGASTVTFTVGTTSTDVAIPAGATLQDIRTAINAANIGVTATIVNDGSGTPYRLSLSSDKEGTSNAISSITVQTGGDSAVNDLLAYNPTANAPAVATMAQTIAAANAVFSVNGIPMIKSSNTVSDAIQGVTLTLTKESTATLTIARDTGAISTATSGFVEAYNALYSQLKTRSAYASAATTAGELAGDGTLRLMLDQMRSIMSTGATPASGGTLTYLSQVGIGTQADGSLKLDSAKFNSAIASNFSDVSNLFSSETGFATRLNTWSTSVAQVGGLIDTHTDNFKTSIKRYNDQISTLELRMTALQKQYTSTYTNLNAMLNNMNATSAYLTQQFSSTSK